MKDTSLPLEGIRILDFCDQRGQGCGRLLADLGAEVILVEPPAGMASRAKPPLYDGASLHFIAHNLNKLSLTLDLASQAGREELLTLLPSVDILLDGSAPNYLSSLGLDVATLRQAHPELLYLSITDFGLAGPRRSYVATESVHMALGTMLSRSGRAGREPLLPPGDMALETASVQAAWVALLAYWQRQFVGRGDLLDFSINDAVAQLLDPGVGATGSASAGRTAVEAAPHSRPFVEFTPGELPSVALMYPVFQCADGAVRLCVLNPRQWHAMSEWLGPDHPFKHKKYDGTAGRLMKIDKINALIAELFKHQTREQLVDEGRKRGIPIASLALPHELFNDSHFAARELFTEVDAGTKKGLMPSGYLRMDGRRIGARTPCPTVGQHTEVLSNKPAQPLEPTLEKQSIGRRPLEGIRVLDLGVIVAGGELGRLFADQGADVIKLENRAFGDGLRQSFDGNPVSIPFAQASRGKRSLGLNLRSDEGKHLFNELVKKADIVLTNFKPGTTESLGIDYETLKHINPGIICAESSAMGSVGPNAKTMGYGPLVRASTSLTGLWRYPDQADGYGDGVTIYPDHFVARVSAVAILAKLIERRRTGKGGFVDLSQAECIMNVLATEFLRESLQPGSMVAKGNSDEFDAPNSIFPCWGHDEWCAISVTNDQQWQALCKVMDRPDLSSNHDYSTCDGRLARREELEAEVRRWCQDRTPQEVMEQCQSVGVPAGKMLRLSEFIVDEHFQARKFFRVLQQPTAGRPLETENGPVGHSETLPEPDIRRAPARAEHTRAVAREVLQLSDDEINELIAKGVLEQGHSAEKGAKSQKFKTFAARAGASLVVKINALRG